MLTFVIVLQLYDVSMYFVCIFNLSFCFHCFVVNLV